MTVDDAMTTVHETCPDSVCKHEVEIRGRRLCTFPRAVLIEFAGQYFEAFVKLREKVQTDQREAMAREGKISPHLYGPNGRMN